MASVSDVGQESEALGEKVEQPTVLLLEESQILHELFEIWLDPIPTECVSTVSGLRAALDSTVTVTCLATECLDVDDAELRRDILNVNPYCQLVYIQERGGFTAVHEDSYDAILQRPLCKADVRPMITDRMRCGIYSVLLRQFYVLNAQLIRHEQAEPDDCEDRAERLMRQNKAIKRQLQQLQEQLAVEDVTAIVRSIALHNRFLTTPASEAVDGGGAKYHPPRCPNCKLPWGIDHGNDLKAGYDRVAAHVRKCTRCNEIVHGLGGSHRRIMGH